MEKVNKDNFPEGTKIVVADDGAVTVTYPDGSTDTITSDKTVKKIVVDNNNANGNNKIANNGGKTSVNTGDRMTKFYSAVFFLFLALVAIFLMQKKKGKK